MPQGPQAAAIATNQANQQALGKFGYQNELWIGARHGRNYAAALTGNVGIGANQSGATTSVGLATTYTGLCLSNPASSGRNLVLLQVAASLIVAPSTITNLALIGGYAAGGVTVHTTALSVYNSILGTSAAALVAKIDAACTLVGTPAWLAQLGQAPTATTSPNFNFDVGGSIIIPPGGYVAIGTDIASPSGALKGSFIWEEVVI